MTCTSVDIKAFALGEAVDPAAAAHLEACAFCREELETLRLTTVALQAIGDEEPPRRLAFVSDKIFEPKWWHAWLRPGPVVGFVSSCIVAAALLVNTRTPAPTIVYRPAAVASIDNAAIQRRIDAAVSASEQRLAQQTEHKLRLAETQFRVQHDADMQQLVAFYQSQNGRLMVAANEAGASK